MPAAGDETDWNDVEDSALRKRIQNRLAQRKHRRKAQEKAESASASASASVAARNQWPVSQDELWSSMDFPAVTASARNPWHMGIGSEDNMAAMMAGAAAPNSTYDADRFHVTGGLAGSQRQNTGETADQFGGFPMHMPAPDSVQVAAPWYMSTQPDNNQHRIIGQQHYETAPNNVQLPANLPTPAQSEAAQRRYSSASVNRGLPQNRKSSTSTVINYTPSNRHQAKSSSSSSARPSESSHGPRRVDTSSSNGDDSEWDPSSPRSPKIDVLHEHGIDLDRILADVQPKRRQSGWVTTEPDDQSTEEPSRENSRRTSQSHRRKRIRPRLEVNDSDQSSPGQGHLVRSSSSRVTKVVVVFMEGDERR